MGVLEKNAELAEVVISVRRSAHRIGFEAGRSWAEKSLRGGA